MIAEPDKIDLITRTADGVYRIGIYAEAGEWHGESETIAKRLTAKLDSAASFALDGQMHRMYPESVGRPAMLAFSSVEPIPPDWQSLIEQLAAIYAKEGLPLVIEPLHFDRAA